MKAYSEEQVKAAIDAYDLSGSAAVAARTCGASHTTVREWLLRAGRIKIKHGAAGGIPQSSLIDVEESLKSHDPLWVASRLQGGDSMRWSKLGELTAPEGLEAWQWAKLLDSLAQGQPLESAAYQAGFPAGVTDDWHQRARAKADGWDRHWLLIRIAMGAAVAWLQSRIRFGGQGWQGAAWLLERMGIPGYERRENVTIDSLGGIGEKSDNELRAIVKAALGISEQAEPEIVNLEEFE